MKIIAFGDIHEDIHNVDKMANLSTASVVVITGDLTNIGKRENAQRVIEYVKRYNQSVYALAGNFDQKDVCDYLSESGINLHGNAFVFQNVGIFGVGGSNPTPFHTPNEYSEEELEALIYKGYEKVNDSAVKIFVSHVPPFNTKIDRVQSGMHVGSEAVRRFIETHQPTVCITGHIHEAAGQDTIGKTIMVNPGMFKDGGYVEIVAATSDLTVEMKSVMR